MIAISIRGSQQSVKQAFIREFEKLAIIYKKSRKLSGNKGTTSGIFKRHQDISGWWEKVFFLRNKNRGISKFMVKNHCSGSGIFISVFPISHFSLSVIKIYFNVILPKFLTQIRLTNTWI